MTIIGIGLLALALIALCWGLYKKAVNIYSGIALLCILFSLVAMASVTMSGLITTTSFPTVVFLDRRLPFSWFDNATSIGWIGAVVFGFLGMYFAALKSSTQRRIAGFILTAAILLAVINVLWGGEVWIQQGIGPG